VLEKVAELPYGENPHQRAAFYRETTHRSGTIADSTQLQGEPPTFNNVADADAAWRCVATFAEPACVIVKHANPCGVASAGTTLGAYRAAFATDPTSAFGGIVALNRPLDAATAQRIGEHKQFVEVLIAPAFDAEARAIFAAKQNVRVLALPLPPPGGDARELDFKRVGGGLLVEAIDALDIDRGQLQVVTRRHPTLGELTDLLFAWRAVRHVRSNAIVLARNGSTVGIGAAQASRNTSVDIALRRAGARAKLAVMASDAFFPFRDGLDVVAEQGAAAVIQPGGSVRDNEVIAAANERGIAMVFTGVRHFRH
jgi:phosphoribosylaminoimidazolecarboxamide formyltransferase/IMP cyclohydrolase